MTLLMKNHLMLCKIGKLKIKNKDRFFLLFTKLMKNRSVHPKKILFLGVHK
jgi:hypothetical protein